MYQIKVVIASPSSFFSVKYTFVISQHVGAKCVIFQQINWFPIHPVTPVFALLKPLYFILKRNKFLTEKSALHDNKNFVIYRK